MMPGCAMTDSIFRTRENMLIKVMHEGGEERPLIIAVNGEFTVEVLADMEEQLKEHEFENGCGDYVFQAYFMDAERDEISGAVIHPAFWELNQVDFTHPEWAKPEDPDKPKKPCMTCGLIDCGGKDVFDACIPF